MKVRVTNGVVKDRTTGRYCSPGDVLEVTKERYDELRAKGDYVSVVKPASKKAKAGDGESAAKAQEAPDADPEPDPVPFHSVEGIAYIDYISKR